MRHRTTLFAIALLTHLAPRLQAEVALAGTEFWGCDLQNAASPDEETFGFLVANPQAGEVTVTVDAATGPLATARIAPGAMHAFTFDRSRMVSGTALVPAAYRLTATAPVRVQQANPVAPNGHFSHDLSALLPAEALGSVYRPLSREAYLDTVMWCDDLPGSITVVAVAVEPTTVTIVPRAPVRGGDLAPSPAGVPIVVTLDRFDVLQLVTETSHGPDLTGSLVAADRPIAVFGGSPITFVPATQVAGEHLEEQCFPVESWGRELLLVKAKQRTSEPDLWRIVAAEDGTGVTLTPPVVPPFALDAGEHLEISTTQDVHLRATAPVQVGQYFVGAGPVPGVSPGDPSLLLAVPVEQFGDEHLVLVPGTHAEDYVTVVRRAGIGVSLDGAPIAPAAWVAIGSTGWERAWIAVSDGLHRVTADGPVGVWSYGYGEYGAYGSHSGSRFERTGKVACAAAAGPAPCEDGTVVLDGSASTGPGTLRFTWSSLTPGVSFTSPSAAVTTATLTGPGPWVASLTVTNGDEAGSCFVTVPAPVDVTPPDAACPEIVSAFTDAPGFARVAVGASATDDCDGAPALVNDRTSGGADASDSYPCGETLVMFRATDAAGLTDSCVTRVVVTDAALPRGLSESGEPWLRVRRDPADAALLEITFEPPGASEAVNLYAGTVAATGLVAYDHGPIACRAGSTAGRLAAPLDPGASRYYLVSSSNCLGEGTRGFRSDGVERPALPADCGPVR